MGIPIIWIFENKVLMTILIVFLLIGIVVGVAFSSHRKQNRTYEPPPVVVSPPEDPIKVELKNYLHEWQMAWENKDFSRLYGFYSPRFYSRGLDYPQLGNYLKYVLYNSSQIILFINDINFVSISDSFATLSFTQRLTVDGSSDKVIVFMSMEKVGTQWLILSEAYTQLE